MKKLVLNGLLASAFLSPFVFAEEAEAREYCREYTKTIRVGGNIESGYGTACMQPDGSWMIVSARGTVDPFDALRARNVTIVSQQPVYYHYGPHYRPVRYYAPRHHYRPSTGFFFSFNSGSDKHWKHKSKHKSWNHHDRHGGGRGHKKHYKKH